MMEAWTIIVIVIAAVAAGVIAGGLGVYAVTKHRISMAVDDKEKQRKGNIARCRDVYSEEYLAQFTEADTQMARKMSQSKEGLRLTLKLPGPSFRLPVASKLYASQSPPSLSGSRAVSLKRDNEKSRHPTLAGLTVVDRRQAVRGGLGSKPDAARQTVQDGIVKHQPSSQDETSDDSSSTSGSGALADTEDSQNDRTIVARPRVEWSNPVSDSCHDSMSEQTSSPDGQPVSLEPLETDYEVVEEYPENTGSLAITTSTSTPLTLASLPRESDEFVFVPPSPSCSSMLEISVSDTLTHPLPVTAAFRNSVIKKMPHPPDHTPRISSAPSLSMATDRRSLTRILNETQPLGITSEASAVC